MLPLGLFRDRTFSAANAMTLVVYAALGAVTFFVVLQLQTVGGYGALQAGVAMLPITFCMLFLASRVRCARHPDRPPAADDDRAARDGGGRADAGPVDADVRYVVDVLPGLTVFGLGLAVMVAPLTSTVLAAAPDDHAGIASGVSNAVARAGSLLAVAALPTARRPQPVRRTPTRWCSTPATRRRWWSVRCCWCWARDVVAADPQPAARRLTATSTRCLR